MPTEVEGVLGKKHKVSEYDVNIKRITQVYPTAVTAYQLISLRGIAYDVGAREVIVKAPGFLNKQAEDLAKQYGFKLEPTK